MSQEPRNISRPTSGTSADHGAEIHEPVDITTSNQPVNDELTTLTAYQHVSTSLSKLGSTIVSLSALAYIVGWIEGTVYFSALGIGSLANQLSAAQLFDRSSDLVLVVAVVIIFAAYYSTSGTWTVRWVDNTAGWCGFVAAALGIVSVVPAMAHGHPLLATILASLSGYIWAAGAGLVVSELVLRLRDSELRWGARHVWLVWVVLSWGLVQAPAAIARANASFDGDPSMSPLPRVSLRDAAKGDWRLLGPVGDKFVLVQLDARPRHFRLLSNLDDVVITPTF